MLPEQGARPGALPTKFAAAGSQTVTMSFAFQNQIQHASSSIRVRRASIGAAAIEACRKHFRNALQGIVLTGSLARDEASFVRLDGNMSRVLGDAEFLLIFQQDSPLPAKETLGQVQGEIESKLRAGNLLCTIGLSCAHPSYLRNLHPHIYAYELRNCGRVLWGSPRVLSLIPNFTPAEIPLEDGWRLLSNRMIEHLAVAAPMVEQGAPPSAEALYSTVKLTLDMATSFLLFCRLYAPTYHQRSERLRTLAKAGAAEFTPPFSIREFAELVAWATRCKLAPDSAVETENHEADRQIWRRAVTLAGALWQWELARLTGSNEQTGSHALMRHWMRKQSFPDRVRGWASLIRRFGWRRSVKRFPRWIRLAWRGSPRYWIYAAAAELFEALPGLVERGPAERTDSDPSARTFARHKIWRWLPVRHESEGTHFSDWRHLVSDTAWNYGEFLKETRS